MRTGLALLVASGIALAAFMVGTAEPASTFSPGRWPMFHYSVTHTGVNPTERILGPSNVKRLHVLWERTLPNVDFGMVNSSAAVGSNSVYIGNGDGKLYAFRRPGGALRWTAKTGRSIQSSPAIAAGIVYVGSNDGYLYAFRGKTGKRVWRVRTGLLVGSSSPTVVDGVVYLGTLTNVEMGGALYAIDAATGAVKWQADLGSSASASSPSVLGDTVYVGNSNGNVLAFPTSCSTPCNPKWLYELGGGFEIGTPVIADGRIFVSADGAGGSFVYALPASCGDFVCEPIWHADTVTPFTFASPAVADGVVYTQGFKLYAFDENCGTGGAVCKPLWRGDARGASSPAVANGVVYAGSAEGRLYAYAAGCGSGGRTCKPLYRGPRTGGTPFATSPAVVAGKVYYGAATKMRVFGLKQR
jgi:outer membrane protein assembly factor BamB